MYSYNYYYHQNVPIVTFPFKNILSDTNCRLPIIAIVAPIRTRDHLIQLARYKKQYPIIGITSYMEFPLLLSNKYDNGYEFLKPKDYLDICQAWLSCFKHPLPTSSPQIDLSQSDFVSIDTSDIIHDKLYDFIYICSPDNTVCEGWQATNRNWEFAKKCIEYFTCVLQLKGVLIGRSYCKHELTDTCQSYLRFTPSLPWDSCQRLLQSSKWLFLPNTTDASPRVITEAFHYNLPVFMNQDILGGWKYIDPDRSGCFFNETNYISQIHHFLQKFHTYTPKHFFDTYFGKQNSGKKLYSFLLQHNLLSYNEHIEYVYPSVN